MSRAAIVLACSLLPGCIELGVYRCGGEDACGEGTCEATGYCSYADESCPSRRRYSELAGGELARACVEPEGGTSTGDASSSSSSSPESSSESSGALPAECGNGIPEQGEECDDGDPIDGNGCNVDCRESGSVLWTATFAGADASRDTGWSVVFLGSGDLVAAGSEQVDGLDDMLMLRLRGDDGSEMWTWRSAGAGEQRIEAVAINAVGQIVAGGLADDPKEVDSAWMGVFDGEGDLVYEDHPPGFIVNGVVGNAGGFIVAGGVELPERDGFVSSYPEGAVAETWTVYSEQPGDDVYIDLDRIAADDVFALDWTDATAVHRVRDQMVEVLGPVDVQPQGSAFHDPSGGLVVAGYVIGSFANDAWLGLVDTDGTLVWSVRERDVELEVDEEFEDVAVDAMGNVIATGFRTGDDKDAWVRKYDAAGELLWTRRFGGAGNSVARAIDVDGEGNIAIAGEIDGDDGSSDFWVAKLAQ